MFKKLRPKNTKFEENKKDKSFETYINRLTYDLYAMPDSLEISTIKDFWKFENIFYGRVDKNYSSVIISTNKLKNVEQGVYLLDFVADAYRQLQLEFQLAVSRGKIPQGIPHFSDFKAVKGYDNPAAIYNKTFEQVKEAMVDAIISNPAADKASLTFRGFYDIFSLFLPLTAKDFPVLLSSVMTSKKTYLPHTGISFEIADLKHGSNKTNVEIIDSVCFEFFINAASKYGFYIDKNAPWRLVANLSSKPMALYMSERLGGVGSVGSYFNFYTEQACFKDFDSLKALCAQAYNLLVDTKPSINEVTRTGEGSYCTKVYNRQPLLDNVEETVPESEWIDLYTKLRNKEREDWFSDSKIEQITKNASHMRNTRETLRYIDRYFNDYEMEEGSFNYALQKSFYRNVEKPFDNFDEYVMLVVKQFNNRTY